ncbi:4-hydroxybutyrate coenzyme A transferase [Planococcus citri]|uniref:4-hydroxybutyrate coenzyme A transferase n=1 Tax=Planococcus citri TaxID=170843 RepID=UPI0031F8E3B0
MADKFQKLASRFGKLLLPSNKYNVEKSAVNFYFTYSPEPAQPLPRDPKWTSAEEAVSCIKSGDTVFLGGAASTPIPLIQAMTKHGLEKKLKNVSVCHIHTEGKAEYTAPECEGIFRSTSFFMAGNVRKAVAEGRSDCVPIFLSEIHYLFDRKVIQPDVAIIQVSPPDEHGFCSLGTSVDIVRSAIASSKIIIAQVNKNMPRTFGDALVHQSHFDYAVQLDMDLPEHGGNPPSANETKIGEFIAQELVEDGATLQMGIGALPDAVLSKLTNHKDLGIHSEMFSVGVIDLVKRGCVTNNKKTINKGKIISSFLIGTKPLYDFVNNNPLIEMRTCAYTNHTSVIAQNPKMTAINSCIEVDITGQVVSDSIGTRMYSGFGGQVDFIRGAGEGLDGKGKPIIAMQSTNEKTGESKITPFLKPGAGVVTTRAHVHYVVTEYGIAYLFGKSLRQRAHALINISHPQHRESLEKAAYDRLKVMPSA